jgi:hypothetical protein
MSSINTELEHLKAQDHDLDSLRELSYMAEFTTKYDLEYPRTITQQGRTSLSSLFLLLKHYSELKIVPENEINWYFREFLKVPDENKAKCITMLFDSFEEKFNQNIDLEAIFVTDEATKEAEKIAVKLSPELRDQFYFYINTGDELTPQIRQAINDELNDSIELEAYQKLFNAFDSKQTLNIGLREPQKGKALTPDQVAAKFDLEKSIATDEEHVAIADEKDPIAQLSSQTQSLYELVKLNRDRLSKEAKNRKDESQNKIDEIVLVGNRTKPAGLEELLKK